MLNKSQNASKINPTTNFVFYFSVIKDLDDKSKKDIEILDKLRRQIQNDEYRQKLRDFKTDSEMSLLHLAAKNYRTNVCIFLIDEIRIGIPKMSTELKYMSEF